MSGQSGGLLYLSRLGFISPEKIFKTVDLPMPFCPINPSTIPGDGIGRRNNLNVFGPNLCTHSPLNSSGKLTIDIALNGHFLTHMPQPVQRISDIMGLLFSNLIASTLLLTWGQNR